MHAGDHSTALTFGTGGVNHANRAIADISKPWTIDINPPNGFDVGLFRGVPSDTRAQNPPLPQLGHK